MTVDVHVPARTIVEAITARIVEYEGRTAQIAGYAREQEDQPSRHELSERAWLEIGSHRYVTRITAPPDAAPSYTAGFLCVARVVRVVVRLDGEPELVHHWHLAVH